MTKSWGFVSTIVVVQSTVFEQLTRNAVVAIHMLRKGPTWRLNETHEVTNRHTHFVFPYEYMTYIEGLEASDQNVLRKCESPLSLLQAS